MYAEAAWGGEVQRGCSMGLGLVGSAGWVCFPGCISRQGSNVENGFRRGEAEGCNVWDTGFGGRIKWSHRREGVQGNEPWRGEGKG